MVVSYGTCNPDIDHERFNRSTATATAVATTTATTTPRYYFIITIITI